METVRSLIGINRSTHPSSFTSFEKGTSPSYFLVLHVEYAEDKKVLTIFFSLSAAQASHLRGLKTSCITMHKRFKERKEEG
jgi:hypothetical protein